MKTVEYVGAAGTRILESRDLERLTGEADLERIVAVKGEPFELKNAIAQALIDSAEFSYVEVAEPADESSDASSAKGASSKASSKSASGSK